MGGGQYLRTHFGRGDTMVTVKVTASENNKMEINVSLDEGYAGDHGPLADRLRALYGKLPADYKELLQLMQDTKPKPGSYQADPVLSGSTTLEGCGWSTAEKPGEHTGHCTISINTNFDTRIVREIPFPIHTTGNEKCKFISMYSSQAAPN